MRKTYTSWLMFFAAICAAASLSCSGQKAPGFANIEVAIAGLQYTLETPYYSIDPGAIDPGATQVFDVEITNSGKGKVLEITDLQLSYQPASEAEAQDPDGPAFKLGSVDLPLQVCPLGEDCGDIPDRVVIPVSFKRYDDPFVRDAVLTIVSNTRDQIKQHFEVKFHVGKCEPHLSVPPSVDLGQVYEEGGQAEIPVQNTGSCTLTIEKIRFEGDPGFTLKIGDAEFQSDASDNMHQLDSPVQVGANSADTWSVTYKPQTGAPAKATLIIFPTNDPEAADGLKVEIMANTTGPCIEVSPSPIEFGGKLINHAAQICVTIDSCGTGTLTITDIYLKEGSSPDYELVCDDLPTGQCPAKDSPLILESGETAQLCVQYTPDVQNPVDPETGQAIPDEGWVVIENNTFKSKLEIAVTGFGVPVECPQPVPQVEEGEVVPPQTVLHLHGDQSVPSSGSIKSYHWTVEQPAENKFYLVPYADFPNPTHQVNVSGTYVYCLDVCDDLRCSSDPNCNTTTCTKVIVKPNQAIHCELTWDTPGDPNQYDEGPDAGSDMDLHFLHPFATGPDLDGDGKPDGWFDLTYDCFWFNRDPKIESPDPNVDDDPHLDRDDTDGAGPENVNLNVPVDGRVYKVGVHYWNDHGYGVSYPMVKCWCYGQLALEVDLKKLGVKMFTCDLWEVATISWPECKITKIQGTNGGPKIVHNYINPAFVTIAQQSCGGGQ